MNELFDYLEILGLKMITMDLCEGLGLLAAVILSGWSLLIPEGCFLPLVDYCLGVGLPIGAHMDFFDLHPEKLKYNNYNIFLKHLKRGATEKVQWKDKAKDEVGRRRTSLLNLLQRRRNV